MARRTPFHAFLTKIASEGKSVSNEANTSRTLATASKTPASSRSSIPTSYLKISPTGGIVAPEKKLIMSEVSSGKHDISPIGGISASSISSTPTTFQKAVSTPTIAIQKPETVVLGGISISPASGVTTSIKRTVAVTEEKPLTNISEKKSITLGSSRPTQTIVTMGTSISSDQISAIKEKISAMSLPETSPGNVHIGSGRSTSGVLPTAQKAIAGPTITLARPSEKRSTPNTANPNKYVPVTEAKPLTVVGSGSTAIPESSDATGFIFRGIPIKM